MSKYTNSGKRNRNHNNNASFVMDGGSGGKEFKRKTRNLCEKKRRDQFNTLISEMSSIVSANCRKMDKSTVLKTVIAVLKSHSETIIKSRTHEIEDKWKPTFLTNEEFVQLVLESTNGFVIVFSISGQIFYISEGIASALGHSATDVNSTFYEMVYEDDRSALFSMLSSFHSQEGRISFSCRMQRNKRNNENMISYEIINFSGFLRTNQGYSIRSGSPSDDSSDFVAKADTKVAFVGIGRAQAPQLSQQVYLTTDVEYVEFASRYSLDWKFLFLDHRAASITGYLPFELLGMSGYDYYHTDDLDEVVSSHKMLMQRGEGTSCNYRFLTKGQHWIWLQTRFFITYHQWNSKPEFVVCTHRVVK